MHIIAISGIYNYSIKQCTTFSLEMTSRIESNRSSLRFCEHFLVDFTTAIMTNASRVTIAGLLARRMSTKLPQKPTRPLPKPRLPPKLPPRTTPAPAQPTAPSALPVAKVASPPTRSATSLMLKYLGRGVFYGAAVTPFIFFWDHCYQLTWIRGPSMTPYLNEDYKTTQTQRDCVLVNRWAPVKDLQRGMVVVLPYVSRSFLQHALHLADGLDDFSSLRDPNVVSIKRIIGLPGDRITPRSSSLFSTSYIVPWNHVWIEGDTSNPKESLDSNTFGSVPMNLVTGRATAILAPRPRWLRWTDWENAQDGPAASQRARVEVGAVQLEKPLLF